MRFNENWLKLFCRNVPSDNEGCLLHKFPKEEFKERWFFLKGNLLFYFRFGDGVKESDPIGVLVLDECRVNSEALHENPFTFSIEFQDAESRHYFTSQSESQCNEWVHSLQCASCRMLKAQLDTLDKKLFEINGKHILEELLTKKIKCRLKERVGRSFMTEVLTKTSVGRSTFMTPLTGSSDVRKVGKSAFIDLSHDGLGSYSADLFAPLAPQTQYSTTNVRSSSQNLPGSYIREENLLDDWIGFDGLSSAKTRPTRPAPPPPMEQQSTTSNDLFLLSDFNESWFSNGAGPAKSGAVAQDFKQGDKSARRTGWETFD